MQGRGYHIDAVANGDDALELVRLYPYDLVLLDEQMPGRSGMEVFDELRRLDPLVPVVMVTKSEEDHTMTEAIGRRVADYLVKPTSPRQVLSVVTRLLEGESIQQQHVAREFAVRFREINAQPRRATAAGASGRRHYSELVDWELRLREAGETGLLASLETLLDDFRREFGRFVVEHYGGWVNGAERPAASLGGPGARSSCAPLLGQRPARPLRRSSTACGSTSGAACCPLLGSLRRGGGGALLLHPPHRHARTRATPSSRGCSRTRSPRGFPGWWEPRGRRGA